MSLSRKDFLKADDFKIEKVDGVDCYVKEMSAKDKENYERSLIEVSFDENGKPTSKQKINDMNAKLCVVTMCDEEGNLIMKPSDAEALSKAKKATTLEKIAMAANKLNGMTVEAIEELEKNLDTDQ